MDLTKGQIMMIQNMVNTELSNKKTVYNPTELINLKKQLLLYNVSNCKHENEQMHQGDGFVYVTCKDCGTDL